MKTKKRYIIIFVIMVILPIAIIASSSPFRFYPTHRIVKEVNCISCHAEELVDLETGNHLRQMDTTQKKVLYNYLSIYGNVSESAYRSIVGPCYSCHVTYGNFKRFGLTDPYLYQVGNYAYTIGNIAVSDSVIDAQYGTVIEWPRNIGNRAIEYFSAGNVAITAELEVLNVTPSNATIDTDLKIILSNYSGQQNGSAVCDCAKTVSLGDIQVINVNNLANDYFNMVLILGGVWNSATLRLNVSGTDQGTQSFIINASDPSAIYSIPKDFTGISYLKTNGSYRAVRLDVVWDVWRNYSVNGNIASSDIIETSSASGLIKSNTCSAPDAMCHINQKATNMGLTDSMGKIGSLYTHEMESVTSKSCKICHLRYRNIDAVRIPPGGGTAGPTVTPPPTSAGAQLYSTYCSSCHGAMASFVGGRTSTQITTAIATVAQMASCCSVLTAAQIQSIADAMVPTPVPTPVPTTGTGTPMPNPTFKFIAWGDTKGGTNVLEAESKSIISKNLSPLFTLYEGDLCDSGPDTACFNVRKNAFNGDLTGATSNGIFDKTFAIRGNHDSSGGSVWQAGFNFQSVAASIGATNYVAQTPEETYSFDYDNSHFVGIDNPCSNLNNCAGDITSSQIAWLDQDLTNAENRGLKHAFLFWHGPAYPVDGHCCGGISSAMTAVLDKHPIVSAGFFGHEHVVEYTHLNSNTNSGLSCSFEQVISGGAGAGLYATTTGRNIDYYLGQIDGYTMVGVNGNDFDISFYKADGTRMKTLSFTETGTCVNT